VHVCQAIELGAVFCPTVARAAIMNRTALSSLASLLSLGALAWSALGCGSTVIGGGEGGGDLEPGCRVEDGCTQPPGVSDEGVAVRWDALGGGVVAAPADTLLLAFGSEAAACADPLASSSICGPTLSWKAEIPLPAELQYAGAVVDLESLIDVGFGPFYSGSQGEPDGACSGGGGTLFGTLEVLAIDASSVTVRITDAFGFGDEVDGTRTLLRCDGGPTEPVVGDAVALTQEQLDDYFASLPDSGGSSSTTTGGGPAPDDRFFVFIDALGTTGGLSCNDPYAYSEECEVERRIVTLSLDPNQLEPGVYPIGPGGAGLTFSESGSNGDGSCWGGGGGGFDEGTVEIVAVDESSIRVIVQSEFLDVSIDATAARCP
jgi:hypothetical protein